MTTPTTSPTSISGADTSTSVMIASRATSRTSGPVISSFLHLSPLAGRGRRAERSEGVGGEGQFVWREAPHPARFARHPLPASQGEGKLDRHPHDLFVCLDHLVAHRDHRLDR